MAENDHQPIYVDVKNLSALVGISEWSLRKLVRTGRLPAYRFDRKKYLFKVAEIIEIIDNSKV